MGRRKSRSLPFRVKKGGGDAGTAKYSSNNIMSLSYAAHINGDKVYDIATGYWIEAKQEAAASAGRMQWSVYLYDDTGTFVEKYVGSSFPEADKDKYLFAGFEIVPFSATAVTYYLWVETISQYSRSITYAQQNSTTLKQYFSGEQGYAINADYAVIDVQPLAVSDNGTYTAPFSKAYSPVTVDVQEQPWQPLEDGYSNFWFELTNDTLSPWLNFSAKNNDAVIDWGDGSGEVALDTLTPTHTYSKAGKYVVKVKGVSGIGRQHDAPYQGAYMSALKYVELNSEVSGFVSYALSRCVGLKEIAMGNVASLNTYTFLNCTNLQKVAIPSGVTAIGAQVLSGCLVLSEVSLPNTLTSIGNNAFTSDFSLISITIPSTVTSIGISVFASCYSLSEIHVLATTPPAIGTTVFPISPSDYIIYVPQGTAEIYKSAAGWSTYADHILEEGQTPNRAMLSRLAKAVETDTDDTEEMR